LSLLRAYCRDRARGYELGTRAHRMISRGVNVSSMRDRTRPLSGRNSTYRPLQILEAGSVYSRSALAEFLAFIRAPICKRTLTYIKIAGGSALTPPAGAGLPRYQCPRSGRRLRARTGRYMPRTGNVFSLGQPPLQLGPAYDPGLLLVSTNQLFANDCPQPIVNNRWLATTASSRCGGYVVRI
jgi:hypothetical protein